MAYEKNIVQDIWAVWVHCIFVAEIIMIPEGLSLAFPQVIKTYFFMIRLIVRPVVVNLMTYSLNKGSQKIDKTSINIII